MKPNAPRANRKSGLPPAETVKTDGPPPIPVLIKAILGLHMLVLLTIVLGFTAATYSLDDIKKSVYFATGPVLMLLSTLAIYRRDTPPPPRPILAGLVGFSVVLGLSTAFSKFRWIGMHESLMYLSGIGFFLSAMVVCSHRWAGNIFIKYLVVQLLLTNIIGLLMFDFRPKNPDVNAVVWHLYEMLYGGKGLSYRRPLQTLLYTFKQDGSMNAMQSTILNRDFYAAFCTLYIPFAMLLVLDPGVRRREDGSIFTPQGIAWRAIGGVSLMFSLICVVYAQSKGEYVFGGLSLAFFLIVAVSAGLVPTLPRRVLAALVGGMVLLITTVTVLLWPMLLGRLKDLSLSIQSRSIIWKGSWNIFLDHPIFGGGPGTFRIYFPNFRAPDYYLHEISHVTLYSHNYFLDLLCETGILGFACFMVFLGAMVYAGGRVLLRHTDWRLRLMMLAALAGLLAIFGSNASSPNARWPIGASSLWTVLGVTCGLILQATPWQPRVSLADVLPGRTGTLWDRCRRPAMLSVMALMGGLVAYGSHSSRQYFKSQTHYLDGLRAMNTATDLMRGAPTEELIRYFREAAAHFQESVRIDPKNYSGWYKLGSVYTTLSQLENDRLQAVVDRPDATRTALEQTAAMMNRYARDAFDTYRSLAAMWPDYAEIHYNFGLLYRRIAHILRTNEALRFDGSRYLQGDPEDWEQEALKHLLRMREMSNRAEVAHLLAQQLQHMGRDDEAIAVLREAAVHPGDRFDAAELESYRSMLLVYLQSAAQLNNGAAIVDALDKLWDLAPLDDRYIDQLLAAAVRHNLMDDLRKALDKLEKQNPLDPRLFRYGMVLAAEDPKAVLDEFERYLATGGRDAAAIAQARGAAAAIGTPGRVERLLTRYGLEAPSEQPAG